MVIEIYDARSHRLLWRGTGETDVFGTDRDSDVAHDVVAAILADFPSR